MSTSMSRRGKHEGETDSSRRLELRLNQLEGQRDGYMVRRRMVGAGWVLLMGLSGGCDDVVSSATTVDSLLPDSPTSTPSNDTNFESNADATHDVASSNQSDVPTAATNHDTVSDNDSDVSVPSSQDAGASTGVSVVDGHLPQLSPGDGSTCGIPTPDGAPLCDPIAQCGCGENKACAFTPDRARMFSCVIPGGAEDGQACVYDDACTKGSVCAQGLCAATCRFDADCGDEKCVTVSAHGKAVENLRVCVAECDPLDASACGAGATCANAPGTATFTCVQQGSGAVDEV